MIRIIISCVFALLLLNAKIAQSQSASGDNLASKQHLAEKQLKNGQLLLALDLSEEIIGEAEATNDTDVIIRAYLTYARINLRVADYEATSLYLDKAENLMPTSNNTDYSSQIGLIETSMKIQQGLVDEALLAAHRDYSKSLTIGDTTLTIKLLNQIGACHIKNKDYDSALFYMDESIAIETAAKNYQGLSNTLQNKAYILLNIGRLDSVLAYLNSSIAYAKQLDNIELETEGLFLLGKYFIERDDLTKARHYLDSAFELIKGAGLLETEMYVTQLYYELMIEDRDYQGALVWYKKSEALQDSLSNQDYRIKLAMAESKYALQQKESELQLQVAKFSNSQLLVFSLLAGVLFLIIIFILQRRLLNTRKVSELILKEVNHEIEAQNEELTLQHNSLINQNTFIEDRSERLQSYLSLLQQLSDSYHINKGEKESAFKEICQLAQYCLKVNRVSIWMYDGESNAIVSELLLNNGDFDITKATLLEKDYPKYFEEMKKNFLIVADTAPTHPATSEFAEGYLDVLNIKSMVDAPFVFNGEFAGVICCEHQDEQRSWNIEDTIFLKALSDFISITLLSEQRQSHNAELQRVNDSLEETVSKRTYELEKQNKQLREYAFINSHLLRAPLARILGLSFLISKEATSVKDRELITALSISAEELDEIVRKISRLLDDGSNQTKIDVDELMDKRMSVEA